MRTKIRIAEILLCVMLAGLALLWATPAEAAYSDTEGHWAQAPIERWSGYSVIEGDHGAFRPDDTMTRGELAKLISTFFELYVVPEDSPFTDVSEDAWYAPYVLRCYSAGILLGDAQHHADPESPITRADAMVLLCRAFGILPQSESALSGFTDAGDVPDYAIEYVTTLVNAGVVRGVTETELQPLQNVSRASVVQMLDGMVLQYINTPGTYALADGTGTIVIAANDTVTLTGSTSARILIAPCGAGCTMIFFDEDKGEAHAHAWDDGTVIRTPTCNAPGLAICSCASCGAEMIESIDALEHEWSQWLTDDDGHYRVCANDPSHVERHTPVWEMITDVSGKERFLCTVCDLETDSPMLALTGSFPKFSVSEFDGTGGGKPVTLSADCYWAASGAEVRFQWYACDGIDGKNGTAIPGATQREYTTDAFGEKTIRYYYCEITRAGDPEADAEQSVCTGVYAAAYTGLPTVCIETKTNGAITKTAYVDAHLRLAPGADAGEPLDCDITIKGRGNLSWQMPKKGYNIKFKEKTDLFGLGKDKKWSLIANYLDRSLLRNWFSSELTAEVWHDADAWSPSYIPVDFVMNGEYLGSYNLVDSIKISKNRVDIPSIEDQYDDAAADGGIPDLQAGGFVLEVDTRLDASHYFTTDREVAFTLKDPDLDDADDAKAAAICKYIQDYIQTVEDVLYSDGFADPVSGYAKYLDADSFVDWYLVNELTKNLDAKFRTSCFMYYDPADGRLHMGPNWDFDLSCGNYKSRGVAIPEGYWIREAQWISRLCEDPVFLAKVRDRWNANRDALDAAVHSAIQQKAYTITVSAELDSIRWKSSKTQRIITGRITGGNEGTAQEGVDFLIDWLNARCAWLDAALNG